MIQGGDEKGGGKRREASRSSSSSPSPNPGMDRIKHPPPELHIIGQGEHLHHSIYPFVVGRGSSILSLSCASLSVPFLCLSLSLLSLHASTQAKQNLEHHIVVIANDPIA